MRILGINISNDKQLEISLSALFGIGRPRALKILEKVHIDPRTTAGELTTDQEAQIKKEIESYTIEGNLNREISSNIKRLKDINSYRGSRHMKNLPTRGQRTKVNSRTVRGNVRKTMGSGRRKVEKT